jgi:pyruvate carboxylase subunit B
LARRLIKVMNTAFRDGFQSVYGARVFTKDFLPAVEACREAGITHYEAGGGARFQALFFYCNENAFDMMDAFRAAAGPDANLQTLSRGINVVGLDSYSRDIIDLHARLFKKHGMTTIRNFDCLNDVQNLIHSGQAIADAGLHHEVTVTMMELPPGCGDEAHTPAFYMQSLRDILDAGIPFHSVCFKDASGTAVPSKVHETIRQARRMLPERTHVRFHTHETAGVAVSAYRAALDAGVDGIDLSMAPVSGGTCQPDMVVMWHALRGTDYELDFDVDKVLAAEQVFRDCMKDYFVPPESLAVEPVIPWSPMPGGALTANTQMMRDNGILDRFREVIDAMSEVVRRGGYGTSVTPLSQFYFQQAFNNVMFGPWERIADGYGRTVLGYFGRTPVPADPEIVRIAGEQLGLPPTTRSPIEMNDENPDVGVPAATRMLEAAGLPVTDEHVFIAATCREKGIAFLQGQAKASVRKIEPERAAAADANRYTVTVDGVPYAVVVENGRARVGDRDYTVDVREGIDDAPAQAPAGGAVSAGVAIEAKMPGAVVKVLTAQGRQVAAGDTLLVIEAMKMEIAVKAPQAGTVAALHVAVGDQVQAGHVLAHLQ